MYRHRVQCSIDRSLLLPPMIPIISCFVGWIASANADHTATGALRSRILVPVTDEIATATVLPNSRSAHELIIAHISTVRQKHSRHEIVIRLTLFLAPDALCLDLLPAAWSGTNGRAEMDAARGHDSFLTFAPRYR